MRLTNRLWVQRLNAVGSLSLFDVFVWETWFCLLIILHSYFQLQYVKYNNNNNIKQLKGIFKCKAHLMSLLFLNLVFLMGPSVRCLLNKLFKTKKKIISQIVVVFVYNVWPCQSWIWDQQTKVRALTWKWCTQFN